MSESMHLTPIGDGNVLLEPGQGLDPSNPDGIMEALLARLQASGALRLLYDLKKLAVVDKLYYDWLLQLHHGCQVCGIELVAVNIRPAAAFGLSLMLDASPPFRCALDVDAAR
jgi:anti-anti-sigma regulatory factor